LTKWINLTARARSESGQTTVEWLMIAGVLTATAIYFSEMSAELLHDFVGALVAGIRTVAP